MTPEDKGREPVPDSSRPGDKGLRALIHASPRPGDKGGARHGGPQHAALRLALLLTLPLAASGGLPREDGARPEGAGGA